MAHLAVARGVGGVRKLVVLKSMRPELVADSSFREMFLAEARLAATLNHPNIVQTFEVVVLGGRPVLVMEYMSGQSLSRLLRGAKKRTALPLTLHLWILNEVLSGLEYVHNATDLDGSPRNLVHRDISPQNVFVTYEGHVKILDFGIAKNTGSIGHTEKGMIKGKVRYMAPEQLIGSTELDRRADLFAVGVMLWEALTGQRLWEGISELEVMHHLMQGQTPAPAAMGQNVAPALEAICKKALAQDCHDRFASAAEMQNALESAMLEQKLGANSRQLGSFVSELFEEQRSRAKQLIEQQMKDEDASPISFVMLDESDLGSDEQPTVGATVGADLHGRPPGGAQGAFAWKHRLRGRGGVGLLALAGGALLLGLVLTSLFHRSAVDGPGAMPSAAADKSKNASAPRPSSVDTARTASPSREAKSVRVTIAASPSRVQLFLDDVPLVGNPFSGELPSDSARHVVRAEAKGFRAQTFIASLASPLDMKIELEALPPTAGRPPLVKTLPAPSLPPPPPPSASGGNGAAGNSCNPPFFFDEQGFKRIKMECLK